MVKDHGNLRVFLDGEGGRKRGGTGPSMKVRVKRLVADFPECRTVVVGAIADYLDEQPPPPLIQGCDFRLPRSELLDNGEDIFSHALMLQQSQLLANYAYKRVRVSRQDGQILSMTVGVLARGSPTNMGPLAQAIFLGRDRSWFEDDVDISRWCSVLNVPGVVAPNAAGDDATIIVESDEEDMGYNIVVTKR